MLIKSNLCEGRKARCLEEIRRLVRSTSVAPDLRCKDLLVGSKEFMATTIIGMCEAWPGVRLCRIDSGPGWDSAIHREKVTPGIRMGRQWMIGKGCSGKGNCCGRRTKGGKCG